MEKKAREVVHERQTVGVSAAPMRGSGSVINKDRRRG